MVKGIGVDIMEVHRMQVFFEQEHRSMRLFTEKELAYINGKNTMRLASACGIFCAKEAFVKAMGRGFTSLNLHEVEIQHDEYGAPHYHITGKQQIEMMNKGIVYSSLSISHDGERAVAFCVLEGAM